MPQQRTRTLVTSALMCAILVVFAQITIPIGPVPFSMAIFGVALAGAMQAPPAAMATLGCYLLLGLVGLPVFAQFKGGPQVLFGPTGGFLMGYFLLALALSLASSKNWVPVARIGTITAGICMLYLFGILWFMLVTKTGFAESFTLCAAPFILPDILKVGLAYFLAKALRTRLAKATG